MGKLSNVSNKVRNIGLGLMVGVGSLMAGDAPVVPSTALQADYALFDWVFGGVVGAAFIFMIARRVKGFIS